MQTLNIKMRGLWTVLLVLSGLIIVSCDTEVRPDRSTGKTNEILIVTNTKAQWEGEIGYIVKNYFGQPLPGLPQPEPMFHLFNVADKDFNKVFKSQHNILIIDINRNFTEPLVETRANHWTTPQRVIKITAPDTASFRRAFNEHKEAFLEAYNALEIERTNEQFKMARSVKLRNIIEKKFGFTMQIPGGFVVAAEDYNFIWLRQSMQKVKQDVELGIIVYEEPYSDTSIFNDREIMILRDSLTSRFIEGPSVGSYMIISRDFIEKVFTVDGYVYNPGDLKRNFIRQMEAIFHTISFGE